MSQLNNIKTIPFAVKRIRLRSALKSCGGLDLLECIHTLSDNKIFVYDDPILGYSDWTTASPDNPDQCFQSNNPSGREITLLPLDHRIVTGPNIVAGGVADCALLTEEELSLVEFKTNVVSDEYIADRSTRAIEQLWHTFDAILRLNCKRVNIDLDEMVTVDFYIVFDKNLDVTSSSATRQEEMMAFESKYGYPLFFANEKIFV